MSPRTTSTCECCLFGPLSFKFCPLLSLRAPTQAYIAQPHSRSARRETVDALIGAVNGFPGGVVIVSHDQHFLTSTVKEMWVVGGKAPGARRFEGSFEDYKRAAVKSLSGAP